MKNYILNTLFFFAFTHKLLASEVVVLPSEANYLAPDGLEVYLGAETNNAGDAGIARFEAPVGFVSLAVTHKTVDEIWYCISGEGIIAVKDNALEKWKEVSLRPGVSVSLPLGVHFQTKNTGKDKLVILGTTTPRWPNDPEEAKPVPPYWNISK